MRPALSSLGRTGSPREDGHDRAALEQAQFVRRGPTVIAGPPGVKPLKRGPGSCGKGQGARLHAYRSRDGGAGPRSSRRNTRAAKTSVDECDSTDSTITSAITWKSLPAPSMSACTIRNA